MNNQLSWSFGNVWNKSLENRSEREMKPRTNMWASELGGSHIDRFLKMTAVKPTNPPNARSLRKFEAGNMMEWIVGLVLKRAGVLRDNQEWLSFQYPTMLEVTGRLDFFAGGRPDWEKAESEISALELPEFFNRATRAIIEHFKATYNEGLKDIVIEVKSCSTYTFEMYERIGASANHSMQAYHYLKSKNMDEAHIVYICRDDLRMLEFGIQNPSEVEDIYKGDIETMTNYILTNERPPLEQEIIFNPDTGRISTNWKVEYSGYLQMLYGYKEPMLYRERWAGKVSAFNRGLARLVLSQTGGTTPTGKPIVLTPGNKEALEELEATLPNYDEVVARAIELAKKGQLKEPNGEGLTETE